MAETNKHVSTVIDEEIKRRKKILAGMNNIIRKRAVEVQLLPGETLARIKQIDGVLVEFGKEN